MKNNQKSHEYISLLFFQVHAWLLALSTLQSHLGHIFCYVSLILMFIMSHIVLCNITSHIVTYVTYCVFHVYLFFLIALWFVHMPHALNDLHGTVLQIAHCII